MPYKKKTYKRSFRRKSPVTVPKSTKLYVKKALTANKETNYINLVDGSSVISYDVPYLAQWSAISQGSTISTREGDRIEPTILSVKGRMFCTSSSDIARIIIFQWRPDNADEAPTMAKLLQLSGSQNSVHSPYILNATDRGKFAVLYDKSFMNDGNRDSFNVKITIKKFMNKFITYNTGTTTGRSQIYMLAFSNIPASSSQEPSWNQLAYIHWKDTA